jgi:hypothetical protein
MAIMDGDGEFLTHPKEFPANYIPGSSSLKDALQWKSASPASSSTSAALKNPRSSPKKRS